jgi:hypothetical protein
MPASGIFKNAVLGSNSPYSITKNEGLIDEIRRKLKIHDLYRSNPPSCSFIEQYILQAHVRVCVKILEDVFSNRRLYKQPSFFCCPKE